MNNRNTQINEWLNKLQPGLIGPKPFYCNTVTESQKAEFDKCWNRMDWGWIGEGGRAVMTQEGNNNQAFRGAWADITGEDPYTMNVNIKEHACQEWVGETPGFWNREKMLHLFVARKLYAHLDYNYHNYPCGFGKQFQGN
jgi:hypothetical protein